MAEYEKREGTGYLTSFSILVVLLLLLFEVLNIK